MGTPVSSGTHIRKLNYSVRRELSDYLDPQDRWKDVIGLIRKPNGDYRYSQHHVRRFEAVVLQGKSPTQELLDDWGTTNCTVGDLVDILKSRKLWSAACFLLPEAVPPAETRLSSPLLEAPDAPHAAPPTRPLGGTEMPAVCRTVPETQRLLDRMETGPTGLSSVPYSELIQITGNFDERHVCEGGSRLGEGGFGTVYKGVLNDTPVAVKKLTHVEDVSLDELRVQFQQEIQTMMALTHENLVDMVAFSCDGQHPCLVFTLMANGSLLDRLACMQGSAPLSWPQRCSIAEGSARGLQYLHSNHHVHRDVKSANILLDENLVAKISDFGLTRASAKRSSTTVMTERIVGTGAYMAPEALRGKITPKSDVFSFGVVLLEILSGLPPVDENREPQFLMEVMDHIDAEDEELTFEDFLDKKMEDCEPSGAEAVYTLACSCLHGRSNQRPVMQQVLLELQAVGRSSSPDLYRA